MVIWWQHTLPVSIQNIEECLDDLQGKIVKPTKKIIELPPCRFPGESPVIPFLPNIYPIDPADPGSPILPVLFP